MAKAHCTLAETGGIIYMGRQYTVRRTAIPADGHELKLLILQPKGGKRPPERTPGVLWIHGGGYAVGMADINLTLQSGYTSDLNGKPRTTDGKADIGAYEAPEEEQEGVEP